MRNPTIRDVAKHAGVGIGTVSRVLNNSVQVSDQTRQRVLAAIKDLGFSPSTVARQLSGGKTGVVGVLSPLFTNPSYVERLRGIQEVLDLSDYDLILYSIRSASQLQRRLHDAILQNRVDGLLVLTLHIQEKDLQNLKPGFPLVLVSEQASASHPHIMIDNLQGGRLATEYLIQNDHHLIGFIGDTFQENGYGYNVTELRFNGFKDALAAHDLPLVAEWCRFGDDTQHAAYAQAYDLLSQEDHPTALVAAYDTLAFGVLQAARELNLRVPQDVAVIGFDDIPAAALLNLTTVRQPLIESGRIGAERLLELLAFGDVPPASFSTVLDLQVVPRGTV